MGTGAFPARGRGGGTCFVKGPLLGCNRCWQRSSVKACTHSPLRPVKVGASISDSQGGERASVVASFLDGHNRSILLSEAGLLAAKSSTSVCTRHPTVSLPAFRPVKMTV